MQITNDDNSIKVDTEKKEEIPDFENVVGLFNLLYKIHKRNNSHLYQNNKEENNDRYNNITSS
jgi:hypothetical protein